MQNARSSPDGPDLRSASTAVVPAEWEMLPPEARRRLERLAQASPLYANVLRQSPLRAAWLEKPRNQQDYRYQAFIDEWRSFSAARLSGPPDENAFLEALREWRRLMSLRIAYRSVNELAPESTAVAEMTRLAEFCIRACLALARQRWTERCGEPHDDDQDRPARFCVIGLGKLGGQELNFSSDVDLVFVYEGEGDCRRGGQRTAFSSVEYFTRVAGTLGSMLGSTTGSGFLFRVDARLRPEGAGGPLVRSLSSLENYYAVAGQAWERMAWVKARPIAGDLDLGSELLESLQSFRYPRHPPPSLLAEVAAMKLRTERELVGAEELERDVKSGKGGIREIEFVAQAFQLLHAGRYPFLQTHATQSALEQLSRYGLLETHEAERLQQAYWFLRRLEHRIQMRDERQTHSLPADPVTLQAIASSLGFASGAALLSELESVRREVRAAYERLFTEAPEMDHELEEWWTFLTTTRVPAPVEAKLARWFGTAPGQVEEFRRFVTGGVQRLVTREHVTRFQHLARSFDALMPQLARPLPTLQRLSRFAERYATPSHFFSACASNPQFLQVLALLFDRSTFIHEFLCSHPDVFEEVIRPEVLRQRKDATALAADLERGPAEAGPHGEWLRLYVRAEQVRYAIAELLRFADVTETERSLSDLAEVVVRRQARRTPGMERVLVVALGKFGGRELTFGSDLDLLLVAAPGEDVSKLEGPVRHWLRELQGGTGVESLFNVDLRLRPHGQAGPLLASLDALQAYHGGNAQFWEKQVLLRARVVAGPAELAQAWDRWRDERLFRRDEASSWRDELWSMRVRIQNERDTTSPGWRSFKTGPGGLVDIEFLCQYLQLKHGYRWPALRTPNTREILQRLGETHLVHEPQRQVLLDNYDFLKRLELVVRRDENKPVAVLPEESAPIAQWMGFAKAEHFAQELERRSSATRDAVHRIIFSEAQIGGTSALT